jgi:hypothetical protein
MVLLYKNQNPSYPLHFLCTHEHFWNLSSTEIMMIAYPNCDNLVENSAWNLWKFIWKFWNCKALSFTNFLVNTLDKIVTPYRWSATSLFFVYICSPLF